MCFKVFCKLCVAHLFVLLCFELLDVVDALGHTPGRGPCLEIAREGFVVGAAGGRVSRFHYTGYLYLFIISGSDMSTDEVPGELQRLVILVHLGELVALVKQLMRNLTPESWFADAEGSPDVFAVQGVVGQYIRV